MKTDITIKKGSIVEWVKWPHKIVKVGGNIIHVRPCNSNGRVRMHSPTTSLKYENGQLTDFNPFNKHQKTLPIYSKK